MPLYFFDLDDGDFYHDEDGSDCVDHEAAYKEARAALPEIARCAIRASSGPKTFTMSVRDEAGETVYSATIAFTEVR